MVVYKYKLYLSFKLFFLITPAPITTGHLPYTTALEVTAYLPGETQYVPWAAALDNLSYIRDMLRHTAAFGAFKVYLRTVFVCVPHVYFRVVS